ncbi:hypothetical protein [Caballeronia sp. KNU42]
MMTRPGDKGSSRSGLGQRVTGVVVVGRNTFRALTLVVRGSLLVRLWEHGFEPVCRRPLPRLLAAAVVHLAFLKAVSAYRNPSHVP